jgi:nucleoside-diphosphate-sugar epimerase
MKVLLAGYTGLLGRYIARALKREGMTVRVVLHQRTVAKIDFVNEADELLWGSLDNPQVLKKALHGVDAVIHSAWKFSLQAAQRPTVNELVTESLYKASIEEGVERFAFISSVAVYGMQSDSNAVLSESSPLSSGDDFIYPSEKLATEKLLLSLDRGSMLLGIFRPGPIFDNSKSPVKKNICIAGKKLAIGFGNGLNYMPYIHAADVADAIVRWLLSNDYDGSIYNITPSECMRHRDWYVAWGKKHGMKLTPVFLRPWMMRFAALGATTLKFILRKPGKVDVEYALAAATRSLRYSHGRAAKDLGWKPVQTDQYRV